ncbi:ADP-ribose glycohydrolase MACROD2-like [Protobothrops mucrosquamatus]|uniref:ADP-ribose glycohydrolase MACROD2-like n=1 Tax=Protobothrops mucrosquamatus TaxID=103944 RepID=UPI0007759077|nr:ADP-ribose glycohydrolase MACROD2-like [Protobothrops mucrosquamatus]
MAVFQFKDICDAMKKFQIPTSELFEVKGAEKKSRSPSPVKRKAKLSENLEDDNEGENGTEVKPSSDELEHPSQEADEAVSTIPSSPADGGENLGEEKESPAIKEHNPVPHATCEEDQADGLQDDSSEVEMNTQADSQISSMEAEDTLITQEETIKEEKSQGPEVDKTNQESKGQDKGAEEGKGKQVIDSVQPEGQCNTENISSIDGSWEEPKVYEDQYQLKN